MLFAGHTLKCMLSSALQRSKTGQFLSSEAPLYFAGNTLQGSNLGWFLISEVPLYFARHTLQCSSLGWFLISEVPLYFAGHTLKCMLLSALQRSNVKRLPEREPYSSNPSICRWAGGRTLDPTPNIQNPDP